ncbi:MAG: hypothetical protein ACREJR_07865 [Candidatus Rokuibacteriota bacterium]
MPHVLHLVKDPANAVALDTIRAQAADPQVRLSVVLMQEALNLTEPLPGEVYRLSDGHADLPPSPGSRAIAPSELLDLIFAADSVVTW